MRITDNNGNPILDRNEDYEYDFATKEDADKFISQKKRGFELSKNKKPTVKKDNNISTQSNVGKNVNFTFLGEPLSGKIQLDEKGKEIIVSPDGKKYSSGLAKNVTDSNGGGAIDFLFFGERGATQYANNEIDNLVKAKIYEEQGKTPKEILDATGWFKGAEGKWRKETDNKFAFSFPNFQLEDGEVKRMKLKDVLNYPQLFKLYPRLENVNLVFRNENTNSVS